MARSSAQRAPLVSRCFLLMAAASLLSSCALRPRPEPAIPVLAPEQAWSQRLSALQAENDWLIKGRLSVQKAKDGFSAGLHWRQEQQKYTLEFYDPLGRKTAVLSGSPQGAELSTSKGERESAADAEKLMLKLLGWSAPVASLRYWVLGIPDPATVPSRLELDGQGRIARLDQSGWQLTYEEYHEEAKLGIPQRILAKGSALDIK